jgi:uncharacterized repeat protein (TIGR03803 family)
LNVRATYSSFSNRIARERKPVEPILAFLLVLTFLCSSPIQAQTLQVLYTFKGGPDGGNPSDGLIQDSSGNLFGTTRRGGLKDCVRSNYCGTVFKVDTSGKEHVIYRFKGLSHGGDGQQPLSGLLLDSSGRIYGTTYEGGNSRGTVFGLNNLGKETILHRFLVHGNGDGANPDGALTADGAGNFYGSASEGGISTYCLGGCGVVFKINKKSEETVLYRFDFTQSNGDGAFPLGSVILDSKSNLFGTTYAGGSGCRNGCGTIFELNVAGEETFQYSFTGPPDGSYPQVGLIRDKRGNFYGSTQQGGTGTCFGYTGCGTIFMLDRSGRESVLYSFKGIPDGQIPGALILASDGSFYGNTAIGGDLQFGTIFKLDANGKETVLYSFSGKSDGAYPVGSLVRDKAGNLFGTTAEGGDTACSCGVVFKLTPR